VLGKNLIVILLGQVVIGKQRMEPLNPQKSKHFWWKGLGLADVIAASHGDGWGRLGARSKRPRIHLKKFQGYSGPL